MRVALAVALASTRASKWRLVSNESGGYNQACFATASRQGILISAGVAACASARGVHRQNEGAASNNRQHDAGISVATVAALPRDLGVTERIAQQAAQSRSAELATMASKAFNAVAQERQRETTRCVASVALIGHHHGVTATNGASRIAIKLRTRQRRGQRFLKSRASVMFHSASRRKTARCACRGICLPLLVTCVRTLFSRQAVSCGVTAHLKRARGVCGVENICRVPSRRSPGVIYFS